VKPLSALVDTNEEIDVKKLNDLVRLENKSKIIEELPPFLDENEEEIPIFEESGDYEEEIPILEKNGDLDKGDKSVHLMEERYTYL
jgi:hypothetical protein